MKNLQFNTELIMVVIPIPYSYELARGIYSTTNHKSYVPCRMSKTEKQLIEGAAKHCGMSRSSFIRFCATKVANELLIK